MGTIKAVYAERVARLEAEIADFDMLIACATGAGSAREILIRERAAQARELDEARARLAALSPSFAALDTGR